MPYRFDEDEYDRLFDEMFGQGERERGLQSARDIGRQIGEAKLRAKIVSEQKSLMEAAAKEAAKKERERKLKADKETKKGRKESELSKQIEDKEFRLRQAGVDSAKKQSKFGKWANLDPDNNLFFDALDLMGRPLNAIANIAEEEAKVSSKLKKKLKKGEITEDEYFQELNKANSFKNTIQRAKDGFSGREKEFFSDALEEHGMEAGPGRFALGLASDMAMDPLNVLGGAIGKGVTSAAKLAGKGVSAIPGANKVLDPLENIFVGKKAKRQTMQGDETEDLLNLARQTENDRLYMQNKSQEDVARAMMQGGRESGERVGREMEAPLRRPPELDPSIAPNALSNQAMQEAMLPGANALRQMSPLDPLSRIGSTSFRSVDEPLSNGITPNAQQKLDWGRQGLLRGDEGADLGVYGQWGNVSKGPQVQAEVQRFISSTRNEPLQVAAQRLATHPSIQRATETLISSNDELRKFAADNGIDIKDLQGYMAHYITKEGRKFVDETGDVVSDGAGRIGGNDKVTQRKIHDSVTNANIKMKQKTGVDQFFNPDAFVATAGGQHRMINYIAHESVKNKVLSDPRFAKELQSGQKAGKKFDEITVDGKRYAVTKGAKDVITNFERHVTDEGVNTLLKGFDAVQNTWKKTALFSAGFHARNALGNFWNMYASGVPAHEVAKFHTKALKSLEGVKARRTGRSAKGANSVDDTYDEFLRQGLKGTGSSADFAKDAERALMSDVTANTKGFVRRNFTHDYTQVRNADNKLTAALDAPFAQSRRLGDTADEISRFALFMQQRAKGKSPEEAAAKVREVLFDYTELTNAERQVFRRMAPFYTWMRKNAEFQVKAFAKSPERFNKLNFTIQEGYNNTDMNQEITPDWLKDNMAIPLPGTDRLLQFNPPAADLAKMTDPQKMLMDGVSPLIKTPFEMSFNTKLFNGDNIQDFPGQTEEMFGMEIPTKAAYMLNQIGPVRNTAGTLQRDEEGASPFDIMQQALGANMARQWNEESFQGTADWKENERLQGLIDKAEKQDGTDIETIKELEKQGVYRPDDHRADASASLDEMGYTPKQRDALIALKNKVYNSNAETAQEVATMLQQMGLPPEVIDLVTSEYLDY